MSEQSELWAKVNTIKRRVLIVIGATANLSHTFRSSQTYQAYTGLCGEAQMAYNDGELTETIVALLEAQANKVVAQWHTDEL